MKSGRVAAIATSVALAAAISTYVVTNDVQNNVRRQTDRSVPLAQSASDFMEPLEYVRPATSQSNSYFQSLNTVSKYELHGLTNEYPLAQIVPVNCAQVNTNMYGMDRIYSVSASSQSSFSSTSLPSVSVVTNRQLTRWDFVSGVGDYGSRIWAVCFEGRRQEEAGNMAEADRFYQMVMRMIEMLDQ